MRARVLAVAHRQAALARADAALSIVAPVTMSAGDVTAAAAGRAKPRTSARTRRLARRIATLAAAAALAVAAVAGTALAAQPGAPLYGHRMWVETMLLPTDPSERAIAELQRLDERLREAAVASAAGDEAGVAAALAAYMAIVDQAGAIASADAGGVAGAALQAGIKHNVEVLAGPPPGPPRRRRCARSRRPSIARSSEARLPRISSPTPMTATPVARVARVAARERQGPARTSLTRNRPRNRRPRRRPSRRPSRQPEPTPKPTPKPTPDKPDPTPKSDKPPKDAKPDAAPAEPGSRRRKRVARLTLGDGPPSVRYAAP